MKPNIQASSGSLFEQLWGWAFAIAILGICVVTYFLADTKDLPLTIIGAVLGVAMTVFATFFLFKGQSKQQSALLNEQREQEKEVEIFKQKLEAYKTFLDALCRYVEIKDENSKSILKFRTAALAMHCDDRQMIDTNHTVGDIIKMYQSPDTDDEKLLVSLFNISDYFRGALYTGTINTRSKEYIDSIKTLTETFEQGTDATDAQDENNDTIRQEESIEKDSESIDGWNDYLLTLKSRGWTTDVANDLISISKPNSMATIRIRKPRKGTFYIVEVLTKDNNSEMAKALKAQFKGARSGGSWWRELTSLPNYGIRSGQLVSSLDNNSKARTVIIKWLDKLTNYIE
ncbi:MAG: hypothetical protein K2M11_08200 [Paramuribaculum sp.]|nr:hypothetical protein [Paramuribaculum sp.]